MSKTFIPGYRRKKNDLFYLNKDGERTEKGKIKYKQLPRKIRFNAFVAKKKKITRTFKLNNTWYFVNKNGDFGPFRNFKDEKIHSWLTGDLDAQQWLLYRIAKVAEELNLVIHVNNGRRTRQEQQVLYDKFINGTGAPANKPGTSLHEKGLAVDAQLKNGTSFWNIPGVDTVAKKHKLFQPYPHEAWHIEGSK